MTTPWKWSRPEKRDLTPLWTDGRPSNVPLVVAAIVICLAAGGISIATLWLLLSP
jgi:hypothetical protein